MTDAPGPVRGFVDQAVAAELPGLRLAWTPVATRAGRSPGWLTGELRGLADRARGLDAVVMRTRPIPHAYRAFFRQIGLDPDVDRIPGERAAVQRLLHGGFRSAGLVADACLVALLRTGVPVWALDAAAVDDGGPGIRVARADDDAPAGSLVVADAQMVHAVLFADPLPASAAGPRTTAVTLFSVAVRGVPEIHVEEALWTCAEIVDAREERGRSGGSRW